MNSLPRVLLSFLLKSSFQITVTSLFVMGIVIFMLGYLPDYSTFDESDNSSIVSSETSTYVNKNFLQNYLLFWKHAAVDNFGFSRMHEGQVVGELIIERSTVSFLMILLSWVFSFSFGSIIGLISGYYYGHKIEKIITFLGNLVISMPSFLLAPILIYFFAVRLAIFPPALWQGPQSLVLPILTMSLRPVFYLARLLSIQIRITLKSDFVKVAKAKGIGVFKLWYSHIIPNSFSSFFVVTGNLFGQLVSSLLIVEALFALPGLGHLFVQSLSERDYPLFLALVLILSLILQMGHRFSDLLMILSSPYKRVLNP